MRSTIRVGLVTTLSVVASVLVFDSPASANEVVTPNGEKISGQYVVILKNTVTASGTSDAASSLAKSVGAKKGHVYSSALRGFSVKATPGQAARLAKDPKVAKVYQDGVAHLTADLRPSASTQTSPPWGLDRIDQRALPVNGGYQYNAGASNVTAYVIDTGIRTAHTQFGGRATVGVDLVGDGQNGQDCAGHGTHVAGTIGGSTYGVAKSVKLVSVRVFGCGDDGAAYSTIIAAVDWVTSHAVKPAVVNMSLGGPTYWPLNVAVNRSIETGISYVLSAGNEDVDACDASPANTLSAITVGATGSYENALTAPASDARSSYSNYGPCLDLFAPGSGIRSAWYTGNTASAVLSGTSMAAPHVTGVAALYLSAMPAASPTTVRNVLYSLATKGVVTNAGTGSPNALLYTYLWPETRITLDATPEPVVSGGIATLNGRLLKNGVAYGGQTVSLFFTPVGGAMTLKGTTVTNSSGYYSRGFTQSVSGTWTARVPTTGAILGSSATDAVAVS